MTPTQPTATDPGATQAASIAAANAAAAARAPAADEDAAAADALTSDFETFLQLLTTQMKNQDPSKPMDSTEFVAQLASFSAVEQQINTNRKLDDLLSAMSFGQASDLAQWIGKAVLSEAPGDFAGQPVPVSYTLPQDATSATLYVSDASGQIVDTVPLLPGSTAHTWDGRAFDGTPLPTGRYRFEVESFAGNDTLGRQRALSFSTVVEARVEPDGMSVLFADGSMLATDQIRAVRSGADGA